MRQAVLFLASLVFLFWGSGPLALLLPVCGGIAFGLGILAERYRDRPFRRVFPALSLCTNLVLLAAFRSGDMMVSAVHAVLGISLPVPSWRAPVGMLVYTLQRMGYVIAVSRGEAGAERNPLKLMAWMAFFPRLLFGPVGRYPGPDEIGTSLRPMLSDLSEGAFRLVLGLAEKTILGDRLIALAAFAAEAGEKSVLLAWLGAFSYALGVTLSCAGICGMAVGLGKLFGVTLPENFREPFAARSVSAFCSRWNVSLGDWCRAYVPDGSGTGRFAGVRRGMRLLLRACAMGLWHGASWNFALWGIWFGVLLLLEGAIPVGVRGRIPPALSYLWVLFAVSLGFQFLQTADLGSALYSIGMLLGLGKLPIWSGDAGYALSSYWLVLLLGMIAAGPLPRRAAARLRECRWAEPVLLVLKPAVLAVLLLASAGYLAGTTLRPSLSFPF